MDGVDHIRHLHQAIDVMDNICHRAVARVHVGEADQIGDDNALCTSGRGRAELCWGQARGQSINYKARLGARLRAGSVW